MRLSQHIDEDSKTTTLKMKTLVDARPVADIVLATADMPYVPAMATPNDPKLLLNFNRTDDAEGGTTITVSIAPGQLVEARQIARVTLATADVSLLPEALATARTILNGIAGLQRMAIQAQHNSGPQSNLAKRLIARAIGRDDLELGDAGE